jgi:hypothetical protein
VNDGSPPEGVPDGAARPETPPSVQFAIPGRPVDSYTDDRRPWEWQSKYPESACVGIAFERKVLLAYLFVSLALSGVFLCLAGQDARIALPWNSMASGADGAPMALSLVINFHIIAIHWVGCVGGTTFSLKWLVHAAAKGKWHLDRRPWRLIVPLIGGVYACVVLTLLDAGAVGHAPSPGSSRPLAVSAALAFLVGYFSDGVSGLLSNIANAVFGTLEKK